MVDSERVQRIYQAAQIRDEVGKPVNAIRHRTATRPAASCRAAATRRLSYRALERGAVQAAWCLQCPFRQSTVIVVQVDVE